MLVDLVRVTTRDGVRLDGMYQESSFAAHSSVRAVCLVHGTGSNFYGSTLFDHLADAFLAAGIHVLRINTRGHDGVSTASTAQGGRRIGAAYELVEECCHDLHAWMEWLRGRAGKPIGLVGHSLGAVKSMYACRALREFPCEFLVAISPPRLNHANFAQSKDGPAFLETLRQARELVNERLPHHVMDVQLPIPYVITALGFVEKYGPESPYDFMPWLDDSVIPNLFTFGELEVKENMAFAGSPQALHQAGKEVALIGEADHFYSRGRAELSSRILTWLGGIRA